jgi:3-isopropylmalate/(R)-2-methylmalate dehydratase small subunit
MVLTGYAHRIGDNITTDAIIAPTWHDADDPAVLAAQCLADVDPHLAEAVRPGDLLLAGQSFGGGDAQEIAVLALQALGFVAVICASADDAMIEMAHIYGLPIVICPEAVAAIGAGAVVRLDLTRGQIDVRDTGQRFSAPPSPPQVVEAVRRAQLLAATRRVVESEGYDG